MSADRLKPEQWQRVKDIAADAMEMKDADRRAYLESVWEEAPELREEVERLLSAHAGDDSLLDQPIRVAVSDTPDSSEPLAGVFASIRKARRRAQTTLRDSPLPVELLERSARRLRSMALIYSIGFALAYAIFEISVHVLAGVPYDKVAHRPGQLIGVAFVFVALAVYLIAKYARLPALRLVYLGLVFQVLGGLGIALVSHSDPWALEGPVWGVSWICVWIMMYPMVVTGPPRLAGIAAFATAAMGPLAILLWVWGKHGTMPSTYVFAVTTAPNFLCAALAWAGARYVYRIGVELGQAKRLGSYRLVSLLGRGGMGEVWEAEHDMLARPAALKLVRPDLQRGSGARGEALIRFEREAQSIAQLTSPHTVNLYDFGLTADEVFYYVMELLDGLDLEVLVRRHGPVPANRAVHLMRQMCASIAEAHERGLVHRDIKPSNVIACRQGLEYDFVKVLDFGIVKERTDVPSEVETATGSRRIEGTPGFIAPEAALGGISDPRTDIYSMGCVGYWLLTGEAVFKSESSGEELMRHVKDPAPSLRERSDLDVPAHLDAVILACLQKEPERRPGSVQDLAARLEQTAVPPWTQQDARGWWERFRPAKRSDQAI